MGDHPGFLTTNPCHTYKRVSTNRSSPLQTKQLMAIVVGLKLNEKKNKNCKLIFMCWKLMKIMKMICTEKVKEESVHIMMI